MELVRPGAEKIYVGKRRANHAMRQEAISALLVEQARRGRRVLRLKAGDPFVFGRGGEEIETLAREGVPFEVVPGITAALGVAAYAGIPLTHRDYAQSCVLVTGNTKDGRLDLDWDGARAAAPDRRDLHGAPEPGRAVRAAGRARPAARHAGGHRAAGHHRTAARRRPATSRACPRSPPKRELQPPTLIIVGEVVRLREKLSWFESLQPELRTVAA